MSEEQDISAQLRQAREQQEQSIEDVHGQTGISLDVLHGLEENRFDVVEPVFTRMALCAYAQHLGLDADAILQQFDRTFGPMITPVEVRTSPSPGPSASSLPLTPSTLWIIGLGIVALLALLLIFYLVDVDPGVPSSTPAGQVERETPALPPSPSLFRQEESSATQVSGDGEDPEEATATTSPAADLPASDQNPVDESGESGAAAEPGPPAPADAAEESLAEIEPAPGESAPLETALVADRVPAGGDSLLLEVEALDSTWVQVRWDGRDLFEGIIPRGERRRWQARDYFLVRSGRAHGLRYWFQNRLLGGGQLGDPTQVLRFRASSAGVSLLGPDLRPLEDIAAPPIDDQP